MILVDFPHSSHDAGRDFWSGVIGHPAQADPDAPYSSLGAVGTLNVEVQQIGSDDPRIHLDVESDDVRAEVARLSALGAGVVQDLEEYVVMRDPGGLVFCVVGVQTGERFDAEATTWP